MRKTLKLVITVAFIGVTTGSVGAQPIKNFLASHQFAKP
jgi:hypothetical protein